VTRHSGRQAFGRNKTDCVTCDTIHMRPRMKIHVFHVSRSHVFPKSVCALPCKHKDQFDNLQQHKISAHGQVGFLF